MRGLALVLLVLTACETRRAKTQPAAAPAPSTTSRHRTAPPPPVPRVRPHPAAPPPRQPTTAAWTHAETVDTAEAWDAAAAVHVRERADCAGADACRAAAYAVVLARKNAMLADPVEPPADDEPAPLPPRVQAVVDALDDYVTTADPADPELPGMKFLAASATTRWRQPDAVARLEALLREHRGDPTAEYAANLLLDLLLRADRILELRAWVAELLADPAFLADKPALRQTLEHLRDL